MTGRPANNGVAIDPEQNPVASGGNRTPTPHGSAEKGDSTAPDPGPISNPEVQVAALVTGALFNWGALAGLIQMGGPSGLAGAGTAGLPAVDAPPPAMVAVLAADLAAGYTEHNGVQTLTLNLEPEHLGKVEVYLVAKGDHLSVRLVSANPEAEAALRENLKDLTEAIQIRTGRYQQVEVRVELRGSQDPDKEASENKRQDSSPDQDRDPATNQESDGHGDRHSDTEPEQRAQGG